MNQENKRNRRSFLKLSATGFAATLLAANNLALDLLGPPAMLPAVAQLAAKVPELRLVIDHFANPRIDGGPLDTEWLNGMEAAGQNENVFCKFSGLVEGTGRSDGTAPKETAFYQPTVDAAWEAFGENRLLYGSNWPVCERFADCYTVQSIATAYIKSQGESALRKVLADNPQHVYMWNSR